MQEDLFGRAAENAKPPRAKPRAKPAADTAPPVRHELKCPNVAKLRESVGLSQSRFAGALGISTATLQNWEQGRRRPDGPARVLLYVFKRHPKIVAETVAALGGAKRR